MAIELLNANKYGDMMICKNTRVDKQKMQKYCDLNFLDNYAKNQDCKNPDDFCYVCCENEFGNMFLRKREKCYDMCDESKKGRTKKGTTKITDGKWIWHKNIPKTKNKAILN